MAILDTKSWSWVNVPIIGPQTLPAAGGTMALFQNSKLVTTTGIIIYN
jgi:acyl CoA:acetate/3-ketoacid CoA transferase beta subunit